MTVEEYREQIHQDMQVNAAANMTNPADEFTTFVTGLLIAGEQFDDYTECYYEGVTRKKGNMRIDGYAMDETDGSCCVFITEYRGEYENDTVLSEDMSSAFRRMRFFIEETISTELYSLIEESTNVYDFAKQLYYDLALIKKFRFFYLTDAYNRARAKTITAEPIAGRNVDLNVWDINRIFELVSSNAQKESIEIILDDRQMIPCVKAVDFVDVTADIDVLQEDAGETGEPKSNKITYTSYLAAVPGQLLCDLYIEHGSRLLEGNVRSFLSARGSVNKGILNTIKNYPGMFFAYNNGIAATATELDAVSTPQGLFIKRIKDLQIVNGGQTTASIANAVLSAKADESVDLSNICVPMKISALKPEMAEMIIPKISEYSNSQNKVDNSDFFSNHPFHIRMEKLSRRMPAPAVHGNQYQQYWFYERTRGQYNQGKMKFKPRSPELKQYELKYPESQVIKMVELSKYMMLYLREPHTVSKGKQEIVKRFAPKIKLKWQTNDAMFNQYFYKRVVSIALLYAAADAVVKESDWYKEKHSYKANVVAYSLSMLFEFAHNNKCEIDFTRIWNEQEVSSVLRYQLSVTTREVYQHITAEDRAQDNVTQWCKQEACWERAKKKKWTWNPDFLSSLITKEEQKSDARDSESTQRIDKGIENQTQVLNLGHEYWRKVLNWSVQHKVCIEKERSLFDLAANPSKLPTEKQCAFILEARRRMLKEGMPIDLD